MYPQSDSHYYITAHIVSLNS